MRTKDNNYRPKYYTNQAIRTKIDRLLQQHASEECKLGTDSTMKEIQKITREQVKIEREIKKIDPEYWAETFGIEK